MTRARSNSFYALSPLEPIGNLSVAQKAAVSSLNIGGRRKKHVRNHSSDADDESTPSPLKAAIASSYSFLPVKPKSKWAPRHPSPLRHQWLFPKGNKPRCPSAMYLMGAFSGLTLRDFQDCEERLSPLYSGRKQPRVTPKITLLRFVLRNTWVDSPAAEMARRYGLRSAFQMEEEVRLALDHVKNFPFSRRTFGWIDLPGDDWAASTLEEPEVAVGEDCWEEFVFGIASQDLKSSCNHEDEEAEPNSSGSDGVSKFDSDSSDSEEDEPFVRVSAPDREVTTL